MVEPISPDDIAFAKRAAIPEFVIEAFNELIALNFSGRTATVLQKDVKALINQKMPSTVNFSAKWLNIEELYESHGWRVIYDSPSYNETYDASFTFSKK